MCFCINTGINAGQLVSDTSGALRLLQGAEEGTEVPGGPERLSLGLLYGPCASGGKGVS